MGCANWSNISLPPRRGGGGGGSSADDFVKAVTWGFVFLAVLVIGAAWLIASLPNPKPQTQMYEGHLLERRYYGKQEGYKWVHASECHCLDHIQLPPTP